MRSTWSFRLRRGCLAAPRAVSWANHFGRRFPPGNLQQNYAVRAGRRAVGLVEAVIAVHARRGRRSLAGGRQKADRTIEGLSVGVRYVAVDTQADGRVLATAVDNDRQADQRGRKFGSI